MWERRTGWPVGNAVVWQSRLSAGICDRLKTDGCEPTFRAKTGLLLDPYFSGTKIKHLLDTQDGLRGRPERAKSSSAPSIAGSSGDSPAAVCT